ncbi:choline transport protein [Rutstroemia sp. NJR-2017a WRK4]|nr:choline transport protein [Rutstroemia sp. NJR-2017a WRK4]
MSSYQLDNIKPGEQNVTTSVNFDVDNAANGLSNRAKTTERLELNRIKDEETIARFGKKQQLKVSTILAQLTHRNNNAILNILQRRFKSLSAVGLTCGLMLTWEVILFTLQFGLQNGGPAGLIYGFLAAWCGASLQAVVMAEMASMIPLAGGPFNWVAILSPPWCRKFLSYLAGWLTVISWQAFVAEVCYTCASLIQGLIILNYEDYDPKLWQATLLFYAIALFGVFINTYLGRLLPRIEALMLILYIVGFFAVLIPVAYLSPHTSAKKVFTVFQNLGGWDSMGLSFFVGWITSVSSFVGNDGADHIAEEISQATKVIPFSIWFSTIFNGVLGFSMLLAVLFGVQDIVAATESATGFPFMEIFVGSLGSTAANALVSFQPHSTQTRRVGAILVGIIVITVVNVFSVSSVMATASRTLWAFSRENGLSYSKFLVKVRTTMTQHYDTGADIVDPNTRLPINAILVTLVINVLLALISIGSLTAFGAFYSVVLAAYQSSFLLAASVMLRKRLSTPTSEIPWGPFQLKRLGVPITILAIIYTILALFFSFWPAFAQVDAATMNWSCLIFGGALIFSMVFWVLYGRKVYVGPIWEFDGQFVRMN